MPGRTGDNGFHPRSICRHSQSHRQAAKRCRSFRLIGVTCFTSSVLISGAGDRAGSRQNASRPRPCAIDALDPAGGPGARPRPPAPRRPHQHALFHSLRQQPTRHSRPTERRGNRVPWTERKCGGGEGSGCRY